MTDSDKTGASEGDLAPEPRRYEPFRFADPRQERIYQRLMSIGPGPAAFFRDACRLLATVPLFETTTHLVAHCYREIESGLRDVLEPIVASGGAKPDKTTSKECGHKAEIRAILVALDVPESDPVAVAWLGLPDYRLDRHAHRDSLRGPRPVDDEFRSFCERLETILDVVTQKYETKYLNYFAALDDLLAKAKPSEADLKRLMNNVPCNYITHAYFFDRLGSPDWIVPLDRHGAFQRPPALEQKEGHLSFPVWPESRYLARMASEAPEVVLRIMLQIPQKDNVRVHEDFADAACRMPADLAACWAAREVGWVELQTWLYMLLPDKLAELMSYLAREGQVDVGLTLAQALLALLTDPRAKKADLSSPPEQYARFRAWEYGRVLKKHVPDLVSAAGTSALEMLCDLLESAVKLSRPPKEEPPTDGSVFWRPAVEEHEQNRLPDLKGMLVVAVRDTAESLIGPEGKAVLDIIEERPYRIFHRIGLHLRRRWPDIDPEGTGTRVADPDMLGDSHLQHELSLLLRERFGSFTPEVQKEYLLFVVRGPDLAAWPAARERGAPGFSSSEDVVRYVRSWQLRRLVPVQTFLEGEWEKRFGELTKKFKPPEHPEFPVYMESFSGPTSPRSADDLRAMSVQELVSYLKDWRPDDSFHSSREGLAAEVAALAASEPERIAAEAERFQDPVLQKYVRRLIWGFNDAAKQKASFPWEQVLGLCHWVVGRPRDERAYEGKYEEDPEPGWAWARHGIADLLSSGFEKQRGEHPAVMPFEFREKAWEILLLLTDDPDPQPEQEGGMDPATQSINSTRGEAMHAVVRYAWWVERHMEEAGTEKGQGASWFDEMPEVREVLDKHLDIGQESSPVIRTVYGQWLPRLTVLDTPWVERNLKKMFPRDKGLRHLRDAAWDTYLIFNNAHDSVFELLRNEYRFAVKQIRETAPQRLRIAEPQQQLAEHLMVLHWRGKLDLDDPESLLRLFYGKAPETLRRHAIEFVGRSLRNAYEAPPAILDRLRKLWEWRVEEARRTSEGAELEGFGWWFASGKFDDSWALEQLARTLELAGKTELDFVVAERLAELAESMPVQVVGCLKPMVEGDKDNLAIHGWREHARSILKKALESTDEEAQKAAEALVHLLGARGHLSFRDLLPGRPPDPAGGGKDP